MGHAHICARSPLVFLISLGFVADVSASDCFDHYNPQAWDGAGVAMVLCRNNSNSDLDTYMTDCEIRYHAGARIQGLTQHGSLDRDRLVYSDYNTDGSHFDFDIDIVCEDRGGRVYTFAIGNGNSWDDGCCRNRDCGSVSCCGSDCSSVVVSDAGYIPPGPDAGGPGSAPACPPLRSREYDDAEQLLSVSAGSSERLSFHVDDVPAPSGLSFALLAMRLYDADYPGQEGEVYVNGQGPLSLPADPAWDDEHSNPTLAVPVAYLQAETNLFEFGAGTRDITHYAVSRLALTVYGSACASQPDAYVPPLPDAHVLQLDSSTSLPDALLPLPDANLPWDDAAAGADAVSGPIDAGENEGDDQVALATAGCVCGGASSRGGILVLALALLSALRSRSRRAHDRPRSRPRW